MNTSPQHWIFLRGLGREAAHWGKFPALFEQSIPNVKVYCIDLPGTGRFHKETSPTSLRKISEHVFGEWKGLTVASPPFLLGISLGAMVALDWAIRWPEVSGVVSINTSVGGLSPFYRRLQIAHLTKSLGLKLPTIENREQTALKLVTNSPEGYQDTLEDWIEIQRKRPITNQTLVSQLIAASLFRPDLKKLRTKGLILASKADQMVQPKCSKDLQEKTAWPLFQHSTSGHDLPLEDPQWVIDRIRDWLRN